MIINHNLGAMNANRNMGINQTSANKSMQKLSSGLRINSAADDAAGLAISEKMRGQIRGLDQASANAQDGISMVQTAEGALAETHSILQRMRELAVQASNDTNVKVDREAIQNEVNQLTSEINRIGNTTEFNTQKLLNGGMASKDGTKITAAAAATATLDGKLGSTNAEFSLGIITDGTTTTGTKAKTADITYAAGDVAIGTWIKVDGVTFTNSEKITLTATAGAANAALIADGFKDANGNKLGSVATVAEGSANTKITIESNSKGALSSVMVQQETSLTGGNAVATATGAGVAIVVDGKGFDLSAFKTDTNSTKDLNDTIARLGEITAADGTKLSDVVKISSNENTTGSTRLTFTSISSGDDSSIRFEASADQAALGLIKATHAGIANQKTGSVAEGATKTLSAAATAGEILTSTAASMAFTTTAAAITAGTRITVNGQVFDLGGVTMAAATTEASANANWDLIKNITSEMDSSVKLSDLVDMTYATAASTAITLTTKEKGGANTIEMSSYADTAFNATVAAERQGAGTAIKVGDKTFELGGVDIEVATVQNRADAVKLLGDVTNVGGTTKLSDVANISFDEDGKLKFEAKAVGPDASIEFMSSAVDAVLGTVVATDLGVDNKEEGKGSVGAISEGTQIIVNDTTFNLGGIEINDPRDTAAVVEAVGNATSGGVKLSELVNIDVKDGKLSFTTKATGETSTIQFEGNDGVLGLVASDVGEANAVSGKNTTIEKTGLQASTALDTTKDITIATGTSFKIALGTDSDVTVNLNTSIDKTYDTANADANVSKSAMDDLVKDINASLQSAGLSGKVSAALSQDNKIQFISETGVDMQLKEAVNSPLSGVLGFTQSADMSGVKNVEQVAGPGTEGEGFTAKLQVGANQGQSMQVTVKDMRAAALDITGNAGETGFTDDNTVTNGTNSVGVEAALNVMDHESATKAVDIINSAIEKVSAQRSQLGAFQNRLEHTIANLGTSSENLTSAESRIRDVDMAKEMSTFSKNNILSQAAQAMLAQANQQPQQVLQLLR